MVDVKGKNLHQLLHGDCTDPNCYLNTLWQRLQNEFSQRKSAEYGGFDRIVGRYLNFAIQPALKQPFSDGTQANFAVVIDDITQSKQVEKALKLSQFSIDHAAESILWVGPEGQIAYVNERACRALGYSKPNLLAMKIGQIDPNYTGENWAIHWRTTVERGPITVESHHITRDGIKTPVEVTFNHIEFEGTEYCCTFAREISWRIWAAEALRDSETALRQSYAELETRNEDLDAFAHTVAHDLKNPLTIVIGYAETLQMLLATGRDLPLADHQRRLQTISKTGRKMTQIINELLMLAAMRKTEIQPKPLNMDAIAKQAQLRLLNLFEDFEAEIMLPPTWPAALGHGPWIEEVWANYLSNAIKYGGRPPKIQLGATRQKDGMIRFWIKDNGPGITPEEQNRLFTPFTQLSQIRDRKSVV